MTGPVLDDDGRVDRRHRRGRARQGAGRPSARRWSSPADGVSGRLPLALGLAKREDRPIGVAVRRYYRSPAKADDDYLESWLELRSREAGDNLLPGYGWIFGLGDGRVNVGLGVLNSSTAFGKTNYRRMLTDWLANTPPEWGMSDEANADGPILGAALPMGFNRVPHYTRGVLLVGDSGGMVNPFNGEGIAYAMESGELAAEVVVQALARPAGADRERALRRLPGRAEGPLRRLLPARRGLREADRQSADHADRHQARHAASDADAVRAQAAGQPDRPARRRRDGPDHQRDDQGGTSGVRLRTPGRSCPVDCE